MLAFSSKQYAQTTLSRLPWMRNSVIRILRYHDKKKQALSSLPRTVSLFFKGHTDTGLVFADRSRDILAKLFFQAASRQLQKLSYQQTKAIMMNTCSFSPILPTIAHWADWSLGRYGFCGSVDRQPKIVFVKADPQYISEFYERYLPLIKQNTRFTLITGDSDATLPLQVDLRFGSYENSGIHAILRSLHDDKRLFRWYSQNLDSAWDKITPIPLGFWESGGTGLLRMALRQDPGSPIRARTLKVFCAHRHREGPQWQKRKLVSERAQGDWKECVDFYESVPPADFFTTICDYPFVMCVGGGGLDPSPKAWTALLAGAIPIIENNPTTMAYRDLPVIFVDSWDDLELNTTLLREWVDRLAPHFELPELRMAVLEKLSMGYWLKRIGRSH